MVIPLPTSEHYQLFLLKYASMTITPRTAPFTNMFVIVMSRTYCFLRFRMLSWENHQCGRYKSNTTKCN